MTSISNNNIAHAIYLASKETKHTDQLISKIIQFFVRKHLLSKVPDILSRLSKIINDKEGRVVAKISSRSVLDEKAKEEIARALTKRYSAKEISLVENLDEKLLGGFKIEVNDEVMDLTIKNKIGKLQEYLISNA
jgi:F-type H+-transporting ATPase subunit delta